MKEGQADSRRHDLDALRAFAMLLGIVLHGAMSFIPGIRLVWGVEDSQANPFYGLLLAMIHGWRMPLFFLISGFFTAMLWKKRGLRSLISHRFKRIFLPLLLSMLTIVPALLIVSTFVRSQPASVALETDKTETGDGGASEQIDVWKAVAVEDIDTIRRYVEAKGDLESKDPFGSTPLHIACFFGRAEAANVLVDAGASLDSRNNDGARPQDLLSIDWGTTSMIARAVGLPLDRKALSEGRIEIAEMMQSTFGVEDIAVLGTEADDSISFRQLGGLLFELPIFHHLWFLWFLCWLVIGFVIAVKAIEVLGLTKLPKRWLLTPRSLLWLVPLTTIPQMFMGRIPGTFGPDTSIGLLPLPAVLGYYAIFFGFGALYFGADDRDQRLGRHGGWMVFLSVVVVFPIGLSLQGFSGPIAQTIYAGVQVLYAWLMSFGMIGLFHRCLSRNRPWVRYISDSSYWLYLAHLPLVMLLQYAVESVAAPAAIKFVGVCTVTTVLLLLSYQLMVRKTWIGVLLNGRRYGVAKRSAN